MPGEKRFRTSVFGFKKKDVNSYIEKMLKDLEDKLREKDEEIASLKNENKELKQKYEELYKKTDQINEDRNVIADVLIKAQEKAQMIIEDARSKALEEKRKLEQMIEQERERLVDIKSELKTLKSGVIDALKKYESQLSEMIGKETEENLDDKQENS